MRIPRLSKPRVSESTKAALLQTETAPTPNPTPAGIDFVKVVCDRCGTKSWTSRRRPYACPECKGRHAHIVNLGREALLALRHREPRQSQVS
jgi:hypothetical protein